MFNDLGCVFLYSKPLSGTGVCTRMAVCTPPQQVCFPVSRQGEDSPAGGHTALSVLEFFYQGYSPPSGERSLSFC